MRKCIFILCLVLGISLVAGCTLGKTPVPVSTLDVGAVATYAVQTVVAQLTLQAQLYPATATPLPTETPTVMSTLVPPEKTAEPSQTPTLTETPPPTNTPTVTVTTERTAIPPSGAKLHVTTNTNCRAGPSPIYRVEGYVTTDLTLDIYGISTNGAWYFVQNPTYPDFHCWVWKWTSEVDGDLSQVTVFNDPWTPTPGVPEVSVDIVRWTAELEGKCPLTERAAGVISSNMAGTYKYQWITDTGQIKENGFVKLAADTSAVVSTSLTVDATSDRYLRLFVVSPVDVKTQKVWFHVKCTP
jgi:hypothetical protein